MLLSKILPHKSLLLHPSFSYAQKVYHKLLITRLPQQKHTLYIDTNDPLSHLFLHLQKLYPESKFIATSSLSNFLGAEINEKIEKDNNQLKEMSAIELLVGNNVMIYQHKQKKAQLCMGIQLHQFYLTNNRNLPQKLAQNIITLSQSLIPNTPLSKCIQKTQSPLLQLRQQINKQYKEFMQQAQQCYQNYYQISKFYKSSFLENGRTFRLVTNLIALMGVNWIFLFAITYGKYGWDVGEPLSYLTNLAIQLIAMMGYFQINKTIINTGKEDFQNIKAIMNLQPQIKMKQFQLAYYKKRL